MTVCVRDLRVTAISNTSKRNETCVVACLSWAQREDCLSSEKHECEELKLYFDCQSSANRPTAKQPFAKSV